MAAVNGPFERAGRALLERADVEVGGERPWDIQVHDERLYRRVLTQGTLGLGDAYMDGWWACDALDQFFDRVQRAELSRYVRVTPPALVGRAVNALVNLQRGARALLVGERHYDLGNDLYEAMLDERMTYSCGYWRDAKDLDEAQEAKLDLACRKLGIDAGMRVLDIGCGWGSFAALAAERYKAAVTGVTVSREQAAYAQERYKGWPIDVRLEDYRDLDAARERFDRVVSIGMFEHVGHRNHRRFMEVAHAMLDEGGLLLLHTIGRDRSSVGIDPWIARHIFPNSALPSMAQITRAAEDLFVVEDVHNFGHDYDPTLMAWHANVERAWDELSDRYEERFHRMWRYYLLSCAGSFRARKLQLWQIVLSKDRGVDGGYEPVR